MPTPYEAVPPPYVKCFTEHLRAAGYYCTNIQKTDYQFKPPLTAWDECGGNGHWRNRPDGAPFFAVFNPTGTHESGMWDRSRGSDGPPLTETDPDAVTMPPYLPDTLKARQALARQYDNIAASDRIVGRILGELEADRPRRKHRRFHMERPRRRASARQAVAVRRRHTHPMHCALAGASGGGRRLAAACQHDRPWTDRLIDGGGFHTEAYAGGSRSWRGRSGSISTRRATGMTNRTTWCALSATADSNICATFTLICRT